MKKPTDKAHPETDLVHFGEDHTDYLGATVPPIFQTSNFIFESWDAISDAFENRTESFIYSRGNNPTVQIAQEKLARLAGAERALLFGSGMAAISAAVLYCVRAGGHVIAVKNSYGPANNLLNVYLREKMEIDVTFVDGRDPEDFARALRPETTLFYLESPSSGIFTLPDLAAVSKIARAHDVKTIIDNTWATPLYQRPLELGIDLEVHSCSKYLGGHSDVVAGLVLGSETTIRDLYQREYEWIGGRIAPMDAWLLLRSLRTLSARLRIHAENARRIAEFLDQHPEVARVDYPGLRTYPQRALAERQMSGYTGLLSFRLKTNDLAAVKRFFNSLRLFKIGVSWGGHESLIYGLAISYARELSPEQFAATGLTYGDLRISVGLEHWEDLVRDLEIGLGRMFET